MLYKALPNLGALEVDEMELWQIAVMIGEDETADYDPQMTLPAAELDGTGPVLRAVD